MGLEGDSQVFVCGAFILFLRVDAVYSDQLAFAFFPRKCVESCGASAKVTAVSLTVFQLQKERCAKPAASRKG